MSIAIGKLPPYIGQYHPHLAQRPAPIAEQQEFSEGFGLSEQPDDPDRPRGVVDFAQTYRMQCPFYDTTHTKTTRGKPKKDGTQTIFTRLRFRRGAGTLIFGPLSRIGSKTETEVVPHYEHASEHPRKVVRPIATAAPAAGPGSHTGIGARISMLVERCQKCPTNYQFTCLVPVPKGWVEAALQRELTRERNIIKLDGEFYLRCSFRFPAYQIEAARAAHLRAAVLRAKARTMLFGRPEPEPESFEATFSTPTIITVFSHETDPPEGYTKPPIWRLALDLQAPFTPAAKPGKQLESYLSFREKKYQKEEALRKLGPQAIKELKVARQRREAIMRENIDMERDGKIYPKGPPPLPGYRPPAPRSLPGQLF